MDLDKPKRKVPSEEFSEAPLQMYNKSRSLTGSAAFINKKQLND